MRIFVRFHLINDKQKENMMENQTIERPMTENKASATPEMKAELTKKQRKIREHRKRIRRAAHYFMHESKNVSTIAKVFNTTEQEIFA